MRVSVLLFVLLAVFAAVVLAAKRPIQKQPSAQTEKESSSIVSGKAPAKKPLKKEPNGKKPISNKKPAVTQKPVEEQFEEEDIFDEEEEEPSVVNKKPVATPPKKSNKNKPSADDSIPQPPKRGQKPQKPIKDKPDNVNEEYPFDLPKPPSPPNA